MAGNCAVGAAQYRPHLTVNRSVRCDCAKNSEVSDYGRQDRRGAGSGSSRRSVLWGLGIASGGVISSDLLAAESPGPKVDSGDLVKRVESVVSEFTLPNGLHFLVMERHLAPVVSCHTYVNVGGFDEVDGKTGIAHLLEHMMFKGTERIGTKDAQAENSLLDQLDEAFDSYRDALAAQNLQGAKVLLEEFNKLQAAADALVIPNAFGSIFQEQGAVGVNASTTQDSTSYFMALPSNKLELWFALESDRLQNPVFRQLYSEKRVVSEERQLRVESAPLGKFQEEFSQKALSNNYSRPVIGFQEDIDRLGRREVSAFFDKHYNPRNTTIAIVGDVDPDTVWKMAQKYFSDWRRPANGAVSRPPNPKEPLAIPKLCPSVVDRGLWIAHLDDVNDELAQAVAAGTMTELRKPARSGPAALLGYYRPPLVGPHGVAVDAVSELLVGGRTSRLVKNFVLEGKAVATNLSTQYPGSKHSGLVLAYGIPPADASVDKLSQELEESLMDVARLPVTDRELTKLRKALRSDLFQLLRSNSSLAATLAMYHVLDGGWKSMLEELYIRENLTARDIQQAAGNIFKPSNCFKGFILPPVNPHA